MKIIEMLSEKISEEISDAESYVKMALAEREEYPDLARVLYGISLEEMGHANKIHDAAVEIINEYREKNGDPPAGMKAVYDYLHKKQIDAAAAVKAMQAMYKEG